MANIPSFNIAELWLKFLAELFKYNTTRLNEKWPRMQNNRQKFRGKKPKLCDDEVQGERSFDQKQWRSEKLKIIKNSSDRAGAAQTVPHWF